MAAVPTFLTKTFLESTLEKHFKRDVKILNIVASDAVGRCENYASLLLRLHITFLHKNGDNTQKLSIIVKTLPQGDELTYLMATTKGFETELGIYGELLPVISNLGNDQKLFAKPLGTYFNPRPTILLEDLTSIGFKMYQSEEGLDLTHCLLIIEKLAYLHAASVTIYEKTPDLITKYKTGLYSRNPHFEQQLRGSISSLIELCEKTSELAQYANKISYDKILEKAYLCMIPSTKFNVLNHGDTWIKNFMFSYDSNGELLDVVFLDFQFSLFSSPALDLHNFWTVSTSVNVKKNHEKNIFSHYHNALVHHLLTFQVSTPPPTIEELMTEVRLRACYSFVSSVISLPISLAKRKPSDTFYSFVNDGSEGSYRNRCFNNPKYLNNITQLLSFHDRLGVFD
ncbi:hypothetical protein RI129_010552 [Pyrocoelia pectoralis]|uniref:CHK kinase-like domain-containing protein n=1 Tax=Pyrocoelia pectoralis TaxID=417401 RepID=A0AAN7ZGL6_9COLE